LSLPPQWPSELPDVATVRERIRGADQPDTVARQEAALAVLAEFIGQVTGNIETADTKQSIPPVAQKRLTEYLAAQGRPTNLFELYSMEIGERMTKAARPYFVDATFNEQTLSRFLSKPLVDRYKLTPWFQALLRQSVSAPGAANLGPDVAAGKKTKADMSVFGITLGEPLNLPVCADGDPPQTCLLLGSSIVQQALRTVGGSPESMPTLVQLPPSRCPDWISCNVQVVIRDNYAVAITLDTLGVESRDRIVAKLTEKYQKPPQPNGMSVCKLSVGGAEIGTTGQTPILVWSTPLVRVTYQAYGNDPMHMTNCKRGTVVVESAEYVKRLDKARQQHEASQPAM
jgi:hypothetical protein